VVCLLWCELPCGCHWCKSYLNNIQLGDDIFSGLICKFGKIVNFCQLSSGFLFVYMQSSWTSFSVSFLKKRNHVKSACAQSLGWQVNVPTLFISTKVKIISFCRSNRGAHVIGDCPIKLSSPLPLAWVCSRCFLAETSFLQEKPSCDLWTNVLRAKRKGIRRELLIPGIKREEEVEK